MRSPRIGIVGVICAALLGVAALVIWLQDSDTALDRVPPEDELPHTQDSNLGGNARISRRNDSVPSEAINEREGAETAPVRDAPDPFRLPSKESSSEPRAVSPGMPADHPWRRALPGWTSQEKLNELGVAQEAGIGTKAGFFVPLEDNRSRDAALQETILFRTYRFDPSAPDGVLYLDLTAFTFGGQFDDSLRYEAVVIRTRDRASWRIIQSNGHSAKFYVPVYDGDTFQVQLRTKDGHTALGYLPIPGTYGRGERNSRDLYRRGRVKLGLRLVAPVQEPRARRIQVNDAAGRPVPDAAVLQLGQEFGRADSMGLIDWPFPPPTPTGTDEVALEERGFMLSAPGYVPVFVPREDVANPQEPPLQITLKAREFVASVWGGTIDERFMCLAPNTYSENWYDNSEILAQGWDLLPLEPDAQVASWDDAFFYLTFSGYTREHLAELRQRPLDREITGLLQSVGQSRRRPRARPFSDGSGGTSHSSSWSDGLEAAIGRPYHGLWPDFYGGWYNGRWKYDAGWFEVVLPYPGKFLLLVGEEYREGMSGSKPGQINHVLYIDALDPANIKGEMFHCPG